MTRRLAGALTWLLVAAGAAAEGLRLGVGTAAQPGPGFVPLITALVLAALALSLLAQRGAEPAYRPVGAGRYRLLTVVAGLVAYALVFERLGFVLATFAFIWFLLAVVERLGWPLALGFAAGSAFVAYVIFDRLLQAQLPGGLLGAIGL